MTAVDPAATIQRMRSTDAAERLAAIDDFVKFHPAEARYWLGEALNNDTAVEVRKAAARGLGEISELASLPALTRALGDPDEGVRRQAITAISGVLHTNRAAEKLRAAGLDPSDIRDRLERTLAQAKDSPEAKKLLDSLSEAGLVGRAAVKATAEKASTLGSEVYREAAELGRTLREKLPDTGEVTGKARAAADRARAAVQDAGLADKAKAVADSVKSSDLLDRITQAANDAFAALTRQAHPPIKDRTALDRKSRQSFFKAGIPGELEYLAKQVQHEDPRRREVVAEMLSESPERAASRLLILLAIDTDPAVATAAEKSLKRRRADEVLEALQVLREEIPPEEPFFDRLEAFRLKWLG